MGCMLEVPRERDDNERRRFARLHSGLGERWMGRMEYLDWYALHFGAGEYGL